MLIGLFVFAWFAAIVAGGMLFAKRAPAVSLGLLGSLLGAFIGFFVSAADGPRGVPAGVAEWASGGLVAFGVVGVLATRARPPAKFLRRAAMEVLIVAPIVAAILAVLLLSACPLYVNGGYCSYENVDQLGGWVTVVVILFLLDAVVLATLLLVSASQAGPRHLTDRHAGPRSLT